MKNRYVFMLGLLCIANSGKANEDYTKWFQFGITPQIFRAWEKQENDKLLKELTQKNNPADQRLIHYLKGEKLKFYAQENNVFITHNNSGKVTGGIKYFSATHYFAYIQYALNGNATAYHRFTSKREIVRWDTQEGRNFLAKLIK